jgi:hypothetical protein
LRERTAWWDFTCTAIAALSIAVLAGWLGDALKGEALFCQWWGWPEAECRARHWPQVALLGVAVALAAVLALARRRLSTLAGVERLVEVRQAPSEALIVLLSPPNHAAMQLHDGAWVQMGDARQWSLSPENLGPLLQERLPWNWQPVLRAVHAHQPRLRHVLLLGSRQSVGALQSCAGLLHCLWPQAHWQVHTSPLQPDFTSLCEVRQALAAAVASLRSELNHQGLRPAINITGGNKTASIAAAIAAMELDLELEYLEDQTLRAYRIEAAHWQAF